MTQKLFSKNSKIYKNRGIVFQYPSILYQKLKALFWDRIFLPPGFPLFQGTTLVFLVLLILYCGHQHRQLNQVVSINTSLCNTIYTQHSTLREQEQSIREQMLKSQGQEDALGDMNHRFQTMAAQVRALHHQTTQLATLGEQVRTLADIEEIAPLPENIGIGGNAQNLSPSLSPSLSPKMSGLQSRVVSPSLSLESSRDSNVDVDVIQKSMDTTRNLLNRQTWNFKILKEKLEIKNEILACTPSMNPTSGIVTCKFGPRLSPFSGKREFHTGIDIANRRGTKVHASARGKVIFAKKKWLIGNLVTIDHGNNIITKYGHLYKFLVKKGDMVNRGDVIGLMGSTGNSTGPHVHYEVVVNGKSENPANYFSCKRTASKN